MSLVSEALTDDHDPSALASGNPALDSWLAEHALGAEARRVSRTFVWHQGDGVVVGYYSLAAHVLVSEEADVAAEANESYEPELPPLEGEDDELSEEAHEVRDRAVNLRGIINDFSTAVANSELRDACRALDELVEEAAQARFALDQLEQVTK